jgi:hypothetical protein
MVKNEGQLGPALAAVFTRYELYAGAAGFSHALIDHMRRCVSYFDQYLGEIKDPAAVTPDDFHRYLVYLPTKPVWKGLKNEQARLLSGTSVTIPTRGRLRHFSKDNGQLKKTNTAVQFSRAIRQVGLIFD